METTITVLNAVAVTSSMDRITLIATGLSGQVGATLWAWLWLDGSLVISADINRNLEWKSCKHDQITQTDSIVLETAEEISSRVLMDTQFSQDELALVREQ